MIVNKKIKKKLLLVHNALNEIKSGSRNDNHGICNNLYFKVDSTDVVENFISYSFEKKYGDSLQTYPIEGSYKKHQSNKSKWDSSTEFGAKRLELLDFMIKLCEELT